MRTLGISIAVAAALAAFPALAAPKDSVVLGMVLEPAPGLDPTMARRRRSARSCTTTCSRA